MGSQKKIVPLSKAAATAVVIDLVPGLRNRINAELANLRVSQAQRANVLSEITGRALQTVARWIDSSAPGLPDLRSLAVMCLQFGVDANWLLGLTRHRSATLFDDLADQIVIQFGDDLRPRTDWVSALLAQVAPETRDWQVHMMCGDDMSPLINPGAAVFFDRVDTRVDSNGIYALEYDGHLILRYVDVQLGRGVVLRCENVRYAPLFIEHPLAQSHPGLRVAGRVKLAFNPLRF